MVVCVQLATVQQRWDEVNTDSANTDERRTLVVESDELHPAPDSSSGMLKGHSADLTNQILNHDVKQTTCRLLDLINMTCTW